MRNPPLSFLATARRSDGHTVGGVGLGGAEGQFQRTRMVGWLTGNKRLSSASRGGDQRTGQSTVASTRSVNKPGTRVEAWRLGLGGVVSGSGRCATGCDAQLSELMEREEKKSHTIPARSGCFCKRRNSLAPVIKTCQSIHTPTLLGSKLPVPASKRKAFQKREAGERPPKHTTSPPPIANHPASAPAPASIDTQSSRLSTGRVSRPPGPTLSANQARVA